MGYLVFIIIPLVVGVITQSYINTQYKRWGSVHISNNLTGAQAARIMLDSNGLHGASIKQIAGTLTDNFDPKSQTLSLTQDVYNTPSVASVAVACHEAGHAVQHASNYGPARARMAIVPVVQFCSNAWMLVFFAGIFFNMINVVQLAVALFAGVVLFQLITLPVEFDASRRALETIKVSGVTHAEVDGARQVLTAAALTYVAAALMSILQLAYFASLARD